jgi:hypothetical protein
MMDEMGQKLRMNGLEGVAMVIYAVRCSQLALNQGKIISLGCLKVDGDEKSSYSRADSFN